MKSSPLAIAGFVLLVSTGRSEADAPIPPSKPVTALQMVGLARLEWGMTAPQIKATYPDIGDRSDGHRMYGELPGLRTGYKLGDCSYAVAFMGDADWEAQPHVYEVYLRPDEFGAKDCSDRLRDELVRRLGAADQLPQATLEWRREGTVVLFTPSHGSVLFIDDSSDNPLVRR